jgi:hypothetical protein
VGEVFPNPFSIELFGLGVTEGKLPFGQLNTADLAKFGVTAVPGRPNRASFEACPNYKNNYSLQASLSVARELVYNLSLEFGYNMCRGVHIQLDQETNYAPTGVTNPVVGPIYAP